MVFFEIVKWGFLKEAFYWGILKGCGCEEGYFKPLSVYILIEAKIQENFELVKLFDLLRKALVNKT